MGEGGGDEEEEGDVKKKERKKNGMKTYLVWNSKTEHL